MRVDQVVAIERCHGCGLEVGPILLPVSIRLHIAEDPEDSPLPLFQLIVACPECRLASSYRGAAIRFRPSRTPGQSQLDRHGDTSLAVRLARRCGVDSCAIPLTIHTTMAAETTVPQLTRAASEWRFDKSCRCNLGPDSHQLADRHTDVTYVIDGIGIPPDCRWTISSAP